MTKNVLVKIGWAIAAVYVATMLALHFTANDDTGPQPGTRTPACAGTDGPARDACYDVMLDDAYRDG